MKRNAVVALLLAVALWPLGQRWLVARYHIDPWKLASFAMYATPNLPAVVLVVTGGPAGLTPLDERTLPAWTRQRLDRFRAERSALGLLRDPADVGRAVLQARPELPDVAVLVQRSRLDRHSALIAVTTDRYVYRRADLSSIDAGAS